MPKPIHFTRADARNLVEFAKMDLGQSPESYGLGCSYSKPSSPKKYYPTLYINGKDLDLPLTGKATIEYRLRSKTKRQDEDGKITHSADVEVMTIETADPEKPKAGGKAVVTKTDFARNQTPIQFAMTPQLKAYQNGLKRPLKTNKRTPAVISRTGYGDLRVAPRISTLKANGVPASKAPGRAEAMANYVSGDGTKGSVTADARQAAAAITRQNRKVKLLSRADARNLVEFAASAKGAFGGRTLEARKQGAQFAKFLGLPEHPGKQVRKLRRADALMQKVGLRGSDLLPGESAKEILRNERKLHGAY
jgi:hypothetical protein